MRCWLVKWPLCLCLPSMQLRVLTLKRKGQLELLLLYSVYSLGCPCGVYLLLQLAAAFLLPSAWQLQVLWLILAVSVAMISAAVLHCADSSGHCCCLCHGGHYISLWQVYLIMGGVSVELGYPLMIAIVRCYNVHLCTNCRNVAGLSMDMHVCLYCLCLYQQLNCCYWWWNFYDGLLPRSQSLVLLVSMPFEHNDANAIAAELC